jgi:hypothetical protein
MRDLDRFLVLLVFGGIPALIIVGLVVAWVLKRG